MHCIIGLIGGGGGTEIKYIKKGGIGEGEEKGANKWGKGEIKGGGEGEVHYNALTASFITCLCFLLPQYLANCREYGLVGRRVYCNRQKQ